MKTWKLKRAEDELEGARAKGPSDGVRAKIAELADMLPEETNWLTIKKHLMLELAPGDRQLFSKRDDLTKKHPPFNIYEQQVRCIWRCITNKELLMPEDKMLVSDPKAYL